MTSRILIIIQPNFDYCSTLYLKANKEEMKNKNIQNDTKIVLLGNHNQAYKSTDLSKFK